MAEAVCIKDMRPGMKNITSTFIVIDKGTTNSTKDGSVVRKCRVADKTGSIFFSLWNEQAEAIDSGDILKLTKGYASVWKGSLVLYSGKYGILEKIGEFTMLYSETPDMSECALLEQSQAQGGARAHTGGNRTENPAHFGNRTENAAHFGNRTDNPAHFGSDISQQNLEAGKVRSLPVPLMEQSSYGGGSGTAPLHPRNHMVPQPQLPPTHPPSRGVPRQQLVPRPPDYRTMPVPRPDIHYHPYQRGGRPLALGTQQDGWM